MSSPAPSPLESALVATFNVLPDQLARTVRDRIDPAWIEQALREGEGISVRRRRMPAEVVVWMVLGACLFAGMSETLAALFRIATGSWLKRPESQHLVFHGLRVCGIDGFTVRLPDTPSNTEAFGKPSSRREDAGYPQTRVVCVVEAATHMIVEATPGTYRDAGVPLLSEMIAGLPGSTVYILDRDFTAYGQLFRLHDEKNDRHWLVRCKKTLRLKTVEVLGPGDELVEVTTTAASSRERPDLPKTYLARRLRYTAGKTEFVVLTSMMDPARFPTAEVAALYHRRWETETTLDELKTEQRSTRMTLRSKTPDGVHQELFALMLAHNLARMEMAEVATLLGVEPTRISFHRAVAAIAHHLHNAASAPPSKLLMYRDFLRAQLAYFLLPERRTHARGASGVRGLGTGPALRVRASPWSTTGGHVLGSGDRGGWVEASARPKAKRGPTGRRGPRRR